jgi:hypothetical protein
MLRGRIVTGTDFSPEGMECNFFMPSVLVMCRWPDRPLLKKLIICIYMASISVTHVITSVNDEGMCARTLKYLNAVLLGKWILNIECKFENMYFG